MTEHLTDEQLIGYIHHTLTDAERETLDQHLTTCPECRAHLAEHAGLLRQIRNDLSADLRTARSPARMNFAAIAPQVKRKRRVVVFIKQSNQLLSSAVAIIVLIAAGYGLFYLFYNIQQPETALQGQVSPIAVKPTEQPATMPTTEAAQPAETPAADESQPSVDIAEEENQRSVGLVEFVMEITGDQNPLSGPVDVAVDEQGNLYVTDGFNNRIQKFDRNGQFLTMWGSQGTNDGQFNFEPWVDSAHGYVAVDGQDQIYVADPGNARIQKFDRDGKFLSEWGSRGDEDGQFHSPTGVDVDGQGNVYVVDSNRDDIQKFDRNGGFLARWRNQLKEEVRHNALWQLAIGEEGNIYVIDYNTNRVIKFDRNGQVMATWGTRGNENGQFLGPKGIATDGQGHIYVVDTLNHRVQVFDEQGRFLDGWGSFGSGPGQFNQPIGITVDREGHIYVADQGNDRIQKFRLAEEPSSQ